MSKDSRYERQLIVPQIGEGGQEKLENSRVTVIGCGGLGSPVLTYLAMAGVGHLRMIDCDVVSLTNLNRQFFFEEENIDQEKCETAALFLKKRNPQIILEPVCEMVTEENVCELIKDSDVVVDCVDRIATRKIIGRACAKMEIPLVEGGVHGFYGYVLPINSGKSACLECMETGSAKEMIPVPAIGAAVGVIGSLQAVECLKIILELPVSYGVMLQYDGIYGEFEPIPVAVRPDCSCQIRNIKE